MKGTIPNLLRLLANYDPGVRCAAVTVISKFSKQRKFSVRLCAHPNLDSPADLVMTVQGIILHPLVLLKDSVPRVRVAAISAVIEFSKQGKISLLVHVPIST